MSNPTPEGPRVDRIAPARNTGNRMSHTMAHPLVYEINTRCWLRDLAAQSGSDPDKSGLEQDSAPVNLLIAKQRNGPTGDVALTFLKAYTRFESAAKVSADDLPE